MDNKTTERIDAIAVLEREYADAKGVWNNAQQLRRSLGISRDFEESSAGKAYILAIECLKKEEKDNG